jgi:outer membrane protein
LERKLAFLITAFLIFTSAALAQPSLKVDALELARQAISNRDYPLARAILDALVGHNPQDVEVNFLLAELDARQGHLDAAVDRFRKLLSRHPELIRVRLDYALALFGLHQDESAEYNFRLALASDLPDPVRENVMRYLHAIRARRRYEIDATASIAPDTNINAATGQSEITLFGLPFTLSEEARKKSGIGAVASVFGEYRFPLTEQLRLRSNANLWRADYPGGKFDDMIWRAAVGPQLLLRDWDLSVLGVFTERWYGNDPYDTGEGPRVELAYHGLKRWRLEGDVEYLRLNYHTQTFLNGDYVSANFSPTFYVTSTSYLRPIVGIFRQSTADPTFSDVGYRTGFGYHQELPYGITIEAQPEVFLSYYDAPDALFGTTRRDRTLRFGFSIYRRDWLILGFDPVFSYIRTDNDSNQALFSFHRNQFQVGFTKEF